MRRAVGVLMIAALARVSAARNHIGDTDPSGTKHGVEAFVRCVFPFQISLMSSVMNFCGMNFGVLTATITG